MKYKVTGYRDYRVQYEVVVEADCEGDVTDERVGVALADECFDSEVDGDVVEEQIESVVAVGGSGDGDEWKRGVGGKVG